MTANEVLGQATREYGDLPADRPTFAQHRER